MGGSEANEGNSRGGGGGSASLRRNATDSFKTIIYRFFIKSYQNFGRFDTKREGHAFHAIKKNPKYTRRQNLSHPTPMVKWSQETV